MQHRLKILLAISCLGFAVLACQAVSGGGGNQQPPATDVVIENTIAPVNTDVPLPNATEEPAGNSDVLLDDDFSVG